MSKKATPPDPATLRARCPRCSTDLWAQRGGQWTLHAAMVKLDDDGALVGRCPKSGCRVDVPIPWLALQANQESEPPMRRRVFVRKKLAGT